MQVRLLFLFVLVYNAGMGSLADTVMRTSAAPETVLLRLILAADLLVDGMRAADWHFLIGATRIDLLGPSLPALLRVGLGWMEIGLAGLMVAGLFTRPVALVAIVLPTAAGMGAYERLYTLQAASRLDILVHTWAVVLTGVVLLIRGGGRLSVDAMLVYRPRLQRFRRVRR
jgi:uncharacterized membrane protein YphA (DoxX/SURF4 family)